MFDFLSLFPRFAQKHKFEARSSRNGDSPPDPEVASCQKRRRWTHCWSSKRKAESARRSRNSWNEGAWNYENRGADEALLAATVEAKLRGFSSSWTESARRQWRSPWPPFSYSPPYSLSTERRREPKREREREKRESAHTHSVCACALCFFSLLAF